LKQKATDEERIVTKKRQDLAEEANGEKDREIERLLSIQRNLEKTIQDQYDLIKQERMA